MPITNHRPGYFHNTGQRPLPSTSNQLCSAPSHGYYSSLQLCPILNVASECCARTMTSVHTFSVTTTSSVRGNASNDAIICSAEFRSNSLRSRRPPEKVWRPCDMAQIAPSVIAPLPKRASLEINGLLDGCSTFDVKFNV